MVFNFHGRKFEETHLMSRYKVTIYGHLASRISPHVSVEAVVLSTGLQQLGQKIQKQCPLNGSWSLWVASPRMGQPFVGVGAVCVNRYACSLWQFPPLRESGSNLSNNAWSVFAIPIVICLSVRQIMVPPGVVQARSTVLIGSSKCDPSSSGSVQWLSGWCTSSYMFPLNMGPSRYTIRMWSSNYYLFKGGLQCGPSEYGLDRLLSVWSSPPSAALSLWECLVIVCLVEFSQYGPSPCGLSGCGLVKKTAHPYPL